MVPDSRTGWRAPGPVNHGRQDFGVSAPRPGQTLWSHPELWETQQVRRLLISSPLLPRGSSKVKPPQSNRGLSQDLRTYFSSVFPKTQAQCRLWSDNAGSRWWDQSNTWLRSLSRPQRPAGLPAVSTEPKHSCGFCYLQEELLLRGRPCPSRVPVGKSSGFKRRAVPSPPVLTWFSEPSSFITQPDLEWSVI